MHTAPLASEMGFILGLRVAQGWKPTWVDIVNEYRLSRAQALHWMAVITRMRSVAPCPYTRTR